MIEPFRSAVGIPRPYLRSVLLLLLAEGPSHGYDLLEAAKGVGVRSAEAGGLYRTLRAMEHDALLESWWEPSTSGPARRTYRLSGAGHGALREAVDELEELRRLLNSLIGRYAALKRDRLR